MPTRKIADLNKHQTCTDAGHNPPGHYVFKNGVYEHTCPKCGHVQVFVVNRPVYTHHPGWKAEGPGLEAYYKLNAWQEYER